MRILDLFVAYVPCRTPHYGCVDVRAVCKMLKIDAFHTSARTFNNLAVRTKVISSSHCMGYFLLRACHKQGQNQGCNISEWCGLCIIQIAYIYDNLAQLQQCCRWHLALCFSTKAVYAKCATDEKQLRSKKLANINLNFFINAGYTFCYF